MLEKLKWRSRRSMLELDLIFDKFIQNKGIDSLNKIELIIYQNLLELEDNDLLLLIQGKIESNIADENKLIAKIRYKFK